jgi:hypothetical protein
MQEVIPGCHGRAPQEAQQWRPEIAPMLRAGRAPKDSHGIGVIGVICG